MGAVKQSGLFVSTMVKNAENNGTEEVGLGYPAPLITWILN